MIAVSLLFKKILVIFFKVTWSVSENLLPKRLRL